MRIDGYQMPKSSFLSLEKDMELIVQRIFANDRLKNIYTIQLKIHWNNLN